MSGEQRAEEEFENIVVHYCCWLLRDTIDVVVGREVDGCHKEQEEDTNLSCCYKKEVLSADKMDQKEDSDKQGGLGHDRVEVNTVAPVCDSQVHKMNVVVDPVAGNIDWN